MRVRLVAVGLGDPRYETARACSAQASSDRYTGSSSLDLRIGHPLGGAVNTGCFETGSHSVIVGSLAVAGAAFPAQ